VSPDIGAWGRTDYLADFDAGSDVDRSDLGEFAAAYGFTSADNNYNALCDFGSDAVTVMWMALTLSILAEEFGKT